MKKFHFKLNRVSRELFFPPVRLKTKLQFIEILMEATRYILAAPHSNQDPAEGEIILYVDKMSRLFFITDDKFYTIVFPFVVNIDDNADSLSFSIMHSYEVDALTISKVITIIRSESFEGNCSIDFAESIYDYDQIQEESLWNLIRELMLLEIGYLRYDKDQSGFEKAREDGNEHKHPLHHIDLFYTNKATFKLGLERELRNEKFMDILNTLTSCSYLIDK